MPTQSVYTFAAKNATKSFARPGKSSSRLGRTDILRQPAPGRAVANQAADAVLEDCSLVLAALAKVSGMLQRRSMNRLGRPRPRIAVQVIIVLIASVLGCDRKQTDPSTASTAASTRGAAPSPPKDIDRAHPVVRIETSVGGITIRLDAVHAPGTVRNFLNYTNSSFYDNTLVHYVDPGKMIVAGGYTADRAPKPPRPSIRNEAHNGLKNVRGTIAMARDQSLIDSATSQFFINLVDAPQRDHQGDTADQYGYCVFGEVIEGLDIAQRISQSPTTNLGGDLLQTPDPPVVVTSIRVIR